MLPDFFNGSWEDMLQGLLEAEDEVPQSPQPVELPEVSLHDLFDVEVDTGEEEQANLEAVNGMFPEWMLSEGESAEGSAGSGDSGVGGVLTPVEVDLRCYEDGFTPSDCETDEVKEEEGTEETVVSAYVKINEEENFLVLDCPENPGHNCRACDFHRGVSGNSEAICALCYMRNTGHCIYSKCFFFCLLGVGW